jgi:hypothetical protein
MAFSDGQNGRGGLRAILIYPLTKLWSGMSVNVVNGNYRVTRKIEGNRQDRIEHNLHNSVYR